MESIASGEVRRACVHAGRQASKLDRGVHADLELKRGGNRGRPTARPDSRLQAIYKNKHGYEGMVKAVADAVKGGAKANVLLLKSEDPLGTLKEWTPRPYRLTVTIRGNKMVLRIQKRDADPIQVALVKIPNSHDHYCAISDCSSANFKGVFMALISKYFPHISKTFITNKDMVSVFDSIKKQGYRVFIRYASTKRLHTTGGEPESVAMRTNVAHHNFFKGLHREGASASTVCYTVTDPRSPNAHARHAASGGTLARDCRFLVAGEAGLLFKTIIPEVLSTSRRRNEYLEKCAESADDDMPEPIVIRFDQKIFGNAKINERCIDMLAQMPNSSISEYHVNPHIHISLVDYMDGSSYDIWVLVNDRLVIIPQIRASGASLRRLVNHIFECIREGKVEKYEY